MAVITPGITAGVVVYDQLNLYSVMPCVDFLEHIWEPYVKEHGIPEFGKIPPEWWALCGADSTPH